MGGNEYCESLEGQARTAIVRWVKIRVFSKLRIKLERVKVGKGLRDVK
jgi:hypothetical protein